MKMYGPTMHCNGKTVNYVKCSKCPRLTSTDFQFNAFSLNHHRSIDRLSVNQTLPQLISMSHTM